MLSPGLMWFEFLGQVCRKEKKPRKERHAAQKQTSFGAGEGCVCTGGPGMDRPLCLQFPAFRNFCGNDVGGGTTQLPRNLSDVSIE